MILALEILGGWLALSLITAPVLIPWYVRRFVKHDEWVEQSHQAPRPHYRFPEIRETYRPR